MFHRRFVATAAITASLIGGPSLARPTAAAQNVDCWLNDSKQSSLIQPWGNGGLEIRFSGSAIYRFVPAGPPTTDNRRMRDEPGRIWLMSGHHSFTLTEQNGDGNRIAVSRVKSAAAPVVDHSSHSKVKLNGHGQSTVSLYANPNHGAAIAGWVSGERSISWSAPRTARAPGAGWVTPARAAGCCGFIGILWSSSVTGSRGEP